MMLQSYGNYYQLNRTATNLTAREAVSTVRTLLKFNMYYKSIIYKPRLPKKYPKGFSTNSATPQRNEFKYPTINAD